LLEHEPELFFTTAHYDGYPMLLVRLEPLDGARARGLIGESYRLRGGTAARAGGARAGAVRTSARAKQATCPRGRVAKTKRKTSRRR
jgi:hypothetical protein